MQKTYCLTAPSPQQIQWLNDLINDCRQTEPLQLRFPSDGDLFFFTCEGNKALSCIIICKVQKDLWECYAFTRPNRRRMGLFSTLLEKLCQETPDDTELIFLLDHHSPDALAAVHSLEMELWRTEYVMEHIISEKTANLHSLPNREFSFPDNEISLISEKICEEDVQGWIFSLFPSPNPTSPIGSCRILAHDDAHFYLYHVEINEPCRNQGWGTRLIHTVLQTLPSNASLSLHVSSENSAAVKLYQKTGFHITETLSYYLY